MPSGAQDRRRRAPKAYRNDTETLVVTDESQGEIDLVELFYYLLEHAKYVIGAVLLGILGAGLITFFLLTPIYESTAKLYVLNSNDSVVNLSDLQIGSYLASDYQEVFKTWEVNERVIAGLNLPYSYKELQSMVSVSNPSNTRILYITVKSPSAREAMDIANEYADVAREFIAETMATEAPNLMSTALESIVPVSPNKTRNLLMGALIGGILAAGILVLMFVLDDNIHSADDILKYTGMHTLAVIPLVGKQNVVPMGRPTQKKKPARREGVQ